MAETANLIASIANIAWPIIIAVVLFAIRKEAKAILVQIPALVGRIRTAKVAGVELILDDLAEKAEVTIGASGAVTPDQLRVAARFEVEAKIVGLETFLRELDKLCIEYEAIRRVMRPSNQRTQEMTKVLVKMRGLAPSVSENMDIYKSSASTGSRLAAVAMMQMEPQKGDIDWLLERFKTDAPFIFYHASLALLNIANGSDGNKLKIIVDTAKKAREVVSSFHGEPDRDTLTVLNSIINTESTLK